LVITNKLRSPKLHTYERIAQVLAAEIDEGTWQPGELLPRIPELEKRFNASRITVRQGIEQLANRGYVYTGYECGYARYLAKHHRSRSACLAYKALVTLDMPVRLFIMGSQMVGYVVLRRPEAVERTYQRLSAAGEFFFHRLPRFWKS
jgi:DNA-binding transcriptional regulator YhcF (GntR family)